MDEADPLLQPLLFGAAFSADNRPGDISALAILGRIRALPGELCDSVAFVLRYFSEAAEGAGIVAKLYVPLGKPPHSGWPVSVFAHGLGDPASDFRRWPFVGRNWRRSRGQLAGRWANHGIATLTPWLPGAGPSEPFASYSPMSLRRNARAIVDGCLALQRWEQECDLRPELKVAWPTIRKLDAGRLVLRADCVSTATLVQLASERKDHEALSGLKAFAFDDFQPSHAYNVSVLNGPICAAAPGAAAGAWSVWARVRWSLAEAQGWPLADFFTPRGCEFLASPVPLPLGERARIYASPLSSHAPDAVATRLLETVARDLGKVPSGREIRDWLYTEEMTHWMDLPALRDIVAAPFYRRYSASTDPFFAENIEPFSPGVPLLVAGRFDTAPNGGLPSLEDRYRHMTLPRIRTLQSWGWDVRLLESETDGGTTFSGGDAQRWALSTLDGLL